MLLYAKWISGFVRFKQATKKKKLILVATAAQMQEQFWKKKIGKRISISV